MEQQAWVEPALAEPLELVEPAVEPLVVVERASVEPLARVEPASVEPPVLVDWEGPAGRAMLCIPTSQGA